MMPKTPALSEGDDLLSEAIAMASKLIKADGYHLPFAIVLTREGQELP